MNQKGKILGFGRYSEKMVEEMKQSLGFSMPVPLLLRVAAHYRCRERRDPFIEELRMLDAFHASVPPFISFNELCTNDAFVARTYTDVTEKFRELDRTEPPTVSSILSAASESLRRAGKRVSCSKYSFTDLPRRLTDSIDGILTESQADHGLTVSLTPSAPVNPTDLFVLLRQTDGMSPAAYRKALSAFFADSAWKNTAKRVFSVEDGGLIALLLANTVGAKIDLNRLSAAIGTESLSALTETMPDACVLCLDLRNYEKLCQKVSEFSLAVHPFASATKESRFVFFKNQAQVEFMIDHALLRLLIPHRIGSAGLPNEGTGAACEPISHTLCCKDTESETVAQNGLLFASATETPQKTFFRNTIDTALTPILALSVSGADYANTGLTFSMTYSQDQTPAAIASALGLYRLQAELGVPTLYGNTERKAGDTALKLNVTAVSETALPTLPNQFAEAHNAIYCLAPARDADNLPDFSALREMLSYLTVLSRANAIKGFRIVCRESILGAIRAMRTESLSCRITDDIWTSEEILPLAILIESDRGGLRARRIGTVIERIGAPQTEKMPDEQTP